MTDDDARSYDGGVLRMAIKNEHSGVVEWLVKRFGLTIEDGVAGA